MFEFSTYPAGEVNVRDTQPSQDPKILYIPYNPWDEHGDHEVSLNDWIFQILMATDIKRRAGLEVELFLPYLPYSRQDRQTSPNYSFSLKVLADILNLQGYKKIYTLDVHSDVAGACINNLVNIPIGYFFHHFKPEAMDPGKMTLIVPDQGAYKRLQPLFPYFKGHAIALKTRDVNTGRITINDIHGDVYGEHCLIVDDICDGGATFTAIGELLESKGAAKNDLFVTHGIFSKGPELDHIDQIYTTNSFRDLTPEGWEHVTVIDAMEILNRYVG